MMAIGAAAGFAGIKLPLVEAAILASVFVIGGLIIGAVRLPVAWAMAVVGLFAVFHGYAHALEAPPTGAGSYILGFLAATALLQGAGLALGWVVHRAVGDLGVRALGGIVLAAGAVVLIAH
jgi:urease accessory protein